MKKSPNTAYFSMEIGLNNSIKSYAGGLGILAGDTLKSYANKGINAFGITLLYKHGYFKQILNEDGIQQEEGDLWDYEEELEDTGITISIPISGEEVFAKVWQYTLYGPKQHKVPVYFLDADIEENTDDNKYISYNLYTPHENTQYKQMCMISRGGIELMKRLNIEVANYHLNESHAAFAIPALKDKYGQKEAKRRIVFTTHTPAEHGHKKIHKDSLTHYLGEKLESLIDQELYEDNVLNLTKLCLKNSKYHNAVAKRHKEVSSKMFPEYKIDYITNGIHHPTWVSENNKKLFTKYISQDWEERPETLRNAFNIPHYELFKAHRRDKNKMLKMIKNHTGEVLKDDVFTIGFARRVDGYKRSNLIFHDLKRLKHIARRHKGLQMIFSGKAYFNYKPAEEVIKSIVDIAKENDQYLKIVYLENYGIDIAKSMVCGVDLWLNNPIKPLEASGTSGMKAALNGVPNFSTIDGWWVEGHLEGVTGWSIGSEWGYKEEEHYEIDELYTKLDSRIMYMYYNNKQDYITIKKQAIALNANYFNTHRMANEYLQRAYLK